MGIHEKKIKDERLKSLDPKSQRRHKINAGMAYQGELVKDKNGQVVIPRRLKNLRDIKLGPKNWPDLWGFDSIVITPDMVGQRVAVFAVDEIKAKDDTFSPKQLEVKKFLEGMGVNYTVLE